MCVISQLVNKELLHLLVGTGTTSHFNSNQIGAVAVTFVLWVTL